MRARMIVGLLGTFAAIVLALWLIDWQALLAAFARLSAGTLLLSALFSIVTTFILAARWATLTAGPVEWYGGPEFHDALVGQVFNLITPAALGAYAYRVVMEGGREGGRTRAMAMLVLELLLGLGAYVLAFLIVFAVGKDGLENEIMSGAALFFAGVLVVLAALFIAACYSAWRGMRLPGSFGLARVRKAIGQVATLPPLRLLSAVALTLSASVHGFSAVASLPGPAGLTCRRMSSSDSVGNRVRAAPADLDPGYRRSRGDVCRAGGPGRHGGSTHLRRLRDCVRAALFVERADWDFRLQTPSSHGVMEPAGP
jgi:uncharacterized membrane protein YbhN (UPF0104 family)